MADVKSKRSAQDRERINMSEDYEVRYWTKKFDVDEARLRKAVDKVGDRAKAVAQELGRSA